MIRNQTVEIEINKGNFYIYKEKYGINIGDKVIVDVSDLTPGSSIEVESVCDICGSLRIISYKLYFKSYKHDNIFCCSKKCSSEKNRRKIYDKYGVNNISMIPEIREKIISTNKSKWGSESYFSSEKGKEEIKNIFIDRYGVDNPQKVDVIKSKTKKTNLEKYGVEFALSSPDVRDRIKKTNLEKYGVEFPSQSKDILDKILSTNRERYGGNSPLSSPEIFNKSKLTLISNYNVDSPLKSDIIKDRVKKTNMSVRGVEWPTQSEEVREVLKENNWIKYGSDSISQSDLFRKENYGISNHPNYLRYVDNRVSLFRCDLNKDHDFQIHYDNYHKRSLQKIPLCTVCNPISELSSIKEKELLEYIRSVYVGEVIQSYRDGLEIDIYLPELKIGFEFNGIYWHSEQWREKTYHLDKTEFFSKRGIRIVHIWEDDWTDRRRIVESMITNLFNSSSAIFARKCQVRQIGVADARDFLNGNHIQGFVNSVVKIGLYYENELVSVMSFDNFEGRKKMEDGGWNLSRFCNIVGFNVVGGASKLLKYFIKKYGPSRIVSYADRDWSVGKLYDTLGFVRVGEGRPDYKYVLDGKRVHKSRFRKSNLRTDLSESKYVEKNKINKIWDCGKIKFEMVLV
jgi:hypothetical protein